MLQNWHLQYINLENSVAQVFAVIGNVFELRRFLRLEMPKQGDSVTVTK